MSATLPEHAAVHALLMAHLVGRDEIWELDALDPEHVARLEPLLHEALALPALRLPTRSLAAGALELVHRTGRLRQPIPTIPELLDRAPDLTGEQLQLSRRAHATSAAGIAALVPHIESVAPRLPWGVRQRLALWLTDPQILPLVADAQALFTVRLALGATGRSADMSLDHGEVLARLLADARTAAHPRVIVAARRSARYEPGVARAWLHHPGVAAAEAEDLVRHWAPEGASVAIAALDAGHPLSARLLAALLATASPEQRLELLRRASALRPARRAR